MICYLHSDMDKVPTRVLVFLWVAASLQVATALGQSTTFNRIITDQPSYRANFLEGLGLPDGGSLMVGTGLINTTDALKPSSAIGLYRFDVRGNLVWSQAYPESDLLDQLYYEESAAKLTLVDGYAYLLAVENPLPGSSAYPMTLRKIDPLTGNDLSLVSLEADGPRDSLGPPVAFAVVDDAAVLIRDDYLRYPWPTESTVQVFGLSDGQLRANFTKERYFEENATAWPAAGLVFIAGAEPFGIYPDGDTLTFPLSIAQSPESGVQPFVALGNLAVYAATQGSDANNILVTASTDGSSVSTDQVALPPSLAQGSGYDLSVWGVDSFAMTIGGQNFPLGVFLFDGSGSGGSELPGLGYLLSPHQIDGPKYAVLSEHTDAPKQRRVLAKSFWSADPIGLVDYVKGDTVALPIPLSSPRPEFFDDILAATQAGSDEILGYRSLADQRLAWVKFDRRGALLSLPPNASTPRLVTSPKITQLPGGGGYLLHEAYSWYLAMAYLYDDDLILRDSVEMSTWGEDFFITESHPDGGVIYAVKHSGGIEVRHLTSTCTVVNLASFDPADFVSGGYNVNALAIGPQKEIALGVVSNLTREPDGTVIVRDSNGALLLGPTTVQRADRPALTWSRSGNLLLYQRAGGDYQEFKPAPDGTLRLAATGQFSSDSIGISSALYLNEDELLISYTEPEASGSLHAALARYRIPEREFRAIHVDSEASRAGHTLEFNEDREVMQLIFLDAGFRALTVSQGPISSNVEPHFKGDASLVVRSPFSDKLYFSIETRNLLPLVAEAQLYDALGRLVHQAVAKPSADGNYHLEIPSELAAGTYVLRFNGKAALCVKH